jgi:hypothetical protein
VVGFHYAPALDSAANISSTHDVDFTRVPPVKPQKGFRPFQVGFEGVPFGVHVKPCGGCAVEIGIDRREAFMPGQPFIPFRIHFENVTLDPAEVF